MTGDNMVASQQDGLDILARQASMVLFGIAGLQLVSGFVLYIAGIDDPLTLGVVGAVAAAFLGLGFWGRKNPTPAIVVGACVWGTGVVLEAVADPATLTNGIIVKILIVVGFVRGIQTARTFDRLKKEELARASPPNR